MSTAPLFPGLGPKIKAAYKTAVAKGAVLFTESEEVEEIGRASCRERVS